MSEEKKNIREFHVHLISDATGSTLLGLSKACMAQFEGIKPVERFWPMIRSGAQLSRVLEEIKANPGPVMFTLVDTEHRRTLQKLCFALKIPCMPVLEPIIQNLSSYLGTPIRGIPGIQHALDDAYFERIDAMEYTLAHDDGRNIDNLAHADVILVGVSRTSKTPTCIFLARRGIRAANIPLVPMVPFPEEVLKFKDPMFVGLTENPERLAAIRKTRLNSDDKNKALYEQNEYLNLEQIEEEVRQARRLFSKQGWPVIDVTRRSVEETAAEIMLLLQNRRAK